jgi:hypothetical protein
MGASGFYGDSREYLTMRKAMIPLAGIAVLAVVLYFSAFVDAFTESFVAASEGHGGLPTCESSHGQEDAKRTSDGSPAAKQRGVNAVLVSNVRKVSTDAERVECTATVLLSDNTEGTMYYIFTKEPSQRAGQYIVRAGVVRFDP